MADQPRGQFILASSSPRRLELLRRIGFEPDQIIAADIDETPRTGETGWALAGRLAAQKAKKVWDDVGAPNAKVSDAKVLGADTVVSSGRAILPKAESREEALACLKQLSGRAHIVSTGICVISRLGTSKKIVKTRVTFKQLSEAEISHYLDSGQWQGKAGGYGIHGLAGLFVRSIHGSWEGVMGLPLYESGNLLNAHHVARTNPSEISS